MKAPVSIYLIMCLMTGCFNSHEERKTVSNEENAVSQNDTLIETELDSSLVTKPVTGTLNQLTKEKLVEVIDSIFQLKKHDLKPASETDKKYLFTYVDSNDVRRVYRYLSFQIVEFHQTTNLLQNFNDIRSMALELDSNHRLAANYEIVIRKGGVTYVALGNFLLIHNLRCNMTKKDYEKDKAFVAHLYKANKGVSWLRSYCGWGKLELSEN